jgi:hypothetical protein
VALEALPSRLADAGLRIVVAPTRLEVVLLPFTAADGEPEVVAALAPSVLGVARCRSR